MSTWAIIASGPSATPARAVRVANAADKVIVINESWLLVKSADILYACDWQWWGYRAPSYEMFAGKRVCGTNIERAKRAMPRAAYLEQVKVVPVVPELREFIFNGEQLGAGGSSAFQAANLAVIKGATRLLLVGVDCHSPNAHWHVDHCFPAAATQDEHTMTLWLRSWASAARQLSARNIDVVNYSPGSALDCFPIKDAPERRDA